MKKLQLNKKTISQMSDGQMANVNGGNASICLASCPRGTRKGKSCCDSDPIEFPPPILV